MNCFPNSKDQYSHCNFFLIWTKFLYFENPYKWPPNTISLRICSNHEHQLLTPRQNLAQHKLSTRCLATWLGQAMLGKPSRFKLSDTPTLLAIWYNYSATYQYDARGEVFERTWYTNAAQLIVVLIFWHLFHLKENQYVYVPAGTRLCLSFSPETEDAVLLKIVMCIKSKYI